VQDRPGSGTGVEASEALAGKLRTLIELIELITSSLDMDEILRQIAAAAVRLTDARCVSLWVADDATRTVELRACSDPAIRAGHPSPRMAYGQGVAGWVTLHDQPIKADDLSRTPMIARQWYAAHGLRSLYALPIAYQDSVVGVLVLMGERAFDLESDEYEILEALIAEAGAAIRNSRLLAESERRRRTAEALADLSRLSSETLDLATVARRVVDSVRTLLGAREAALYRLVPETGDLAALALMGEREQALGLGAVFPRGTGVMGLAVRERRPIATSNFANDPRLRHDPAILERLEGVSYRAVLALPLRLKDRVIGALAVCDSAGRVFLDSEMRLAQAFADHAALVLESVQLLDETARRRHEVDVLAEVVGQINSSLDLSTILSRIAAGACELTGADGAQIALREPGTDGARVIYRRGGGRAADDALIGILIEPGKGSGGLVLRTGQPFRTTSYAEDPRITRDYVDQVRAAGVVAQIVMPIQDGELKGLLYVFNRSARAFTDRDEAALSRLANHAAVAIGNAHLLGEMERRRREAEILAEVGRLVSQSLEPDEVGQRIVESIGPLLGSAEATLYRISLETGDFVLLASTGVGVDWNRTLPRGTAAVGLAVREGRPVSTPDVLTDPRITLAPETRGALEDFEHRAVLALPLVAGERIFGALGALGRTGRIFTPDEIRLAQTFVDQAAIALDNARLHSETTRRKWEAEVLAGVGRLVTESLDADEVAGRIADSLRALLGGLASVLVRVEPVTGALVGRHTSADGTSRDLVFPAGTGALGRAVRTRRPVATTNVLTDPRIALTPELREWLQSRPHRAALALPMIVDDRVVGAIAVGDHEGRAYEGDEVRLAQAFVDQAAMALEKARLFEDSERRRREAEMATEEVTRARETLLQTQKMEAIGRLAGGVAHDFNNLLTIIHGRCEILRKRFESGTKPRQDLELIQQTAHRAAALTRQLLAFSRKQVLQPRVLGLNAAVDESVSMLQRLIGEHITLTTVPGARRDRVKADPTQLEQVLMNLTINARDAMPGGGRLTIETADVELDETFAREHPGAGTGLHVRLSVTDDGVGMSAEIRARIFEPFFTTKEKGRGTGLGLSMVYGIVKQHGGYVGVRSEEGRGTTFEIYLPCASLTDEDRAEQTPEREGESRGSETILLVEDEADVRELAREILEMTGYTVLEAARGDEALRLCRESPRPIDLLLTDVVMPQMSGPELARRLLELRPHTKVVYMSGYTDDALGDHGVLDPEIILLLKPFTPESLMQHLRRALDAPAKRD